MKLPNFPKVSVSQFLEFDKDFQKLIPHPDVTHNMFPEGDYKAWGCDFLFNGFAFFEIIKDVIAVMAKRRGGQTSNYRPQYFVDLGCSIGHKLYIIRHQLLAWRAIGVELRKETVEKAKELFKHHQITIYNQDILNSCTLLKSLSSDSLIYTYNPIKGKQKELALFILQNMPVGSYWLELRNVDYKPAGGSFSGYSDQLIHRVSKTRFIALNEWSEICGRFNLKDILK
jgi:hypothetical protein